MRSPFKDRQPVYFSTITEKKSGIDTIQEYSKPIMAKLTASAGTGALRKYRQDLWWTMIANSLRIIRN